MNIKANIILIGGATRNVGKTTFSCSIIRKFYRQHSIIGLKIKTLYADDSFFHGKERNPLEGNFRIIEETDDSGSEDTMLMLKAGAKRVFRIKTKSEFIAEAFNEFYKQITEGSLILCESNSLRKAIKPGLFLMIKHKNSPDIKPSAKELEPFVDQIIYTDGKKHEFDLNRIEADQKSWTLLN